MQAQVAGDYSAALRAYAESLKLEEDPNLGNGHCETTRKLHVMQPMQGSTEVTSSTTLASFLAPTVSMSRQLSPTCLPVT